MPEEQKVVNTLALPCMASRVRSVHSAEELATTMRLARELNLPQLPLGSGSNVVLPRRLEAVVLHCADDTITVLHTDKNSVEIRVGAGHDWHALVQATLAERWYGFENLALIPGTVGAAPVQNIGAYGKELEDFVTTVHGVDLATGLPRSFSNPECEFTYRNSVFKRALRGRFLITAVDFRLSLHPILDASYARLKDVLAGGAYPPTPEGVFAAVVDIRCERLPDPATHPNVGSFFENPVIATSDAEPLKESHPDMHVISLRGGRSKLSAAWLIEASGLRGLQLGAAGVSRQHSLVLENLGGATQADMLALASHVRDVVHERFGIVLQVEPRLYGRTGSEIALA